MYRIAIVEDTEQDARLLMSALDKYAAQKHVQLEYEWISSAARFLEDYRGQYYLQDDLPITLPVTTKEDRGFHGFGTRSIQILTEKYGGDLSMTVEDGIFRLPIMLPIAAAA